ncbi:transposase [Bacteroides graminisolvens]|uniref:transposase n=1 Tax=Bacteroides graminisolvens TaxID=477666 RepID=UPI0029C6F838|nr:transposase [Bacteroides graminisolvens]
MINTTPSSPSLFSSLGDLLNRQYPLHKLSHKINWSVFEESFISLYCPDNGRPAKPIRLMCGLLILKHLRNLSDESVVEQWSENAYFQYFCGMHEFVPSFPFNSSEQNNITYPTDAKLHKKIVGKVFKIVKELNLPIRQSYTFVLKSIYRDQRFRNHPKNRTKALKADKRLRTIAGRPVRELKRNLGDNSPYDELLSIFEKILLQRRNSSHKIYSIHEPDVQCISKGKEHKKYEFGNKVSIIRSATSVILGASSFRNEYDGHTIEKNLEQVHRLRGKSIRRLAGDRGYRGRKEINGTQILIPDAPKTKDTYYQRKKKHKLFCKRAGIEPTIGHLKTDYRLGRNFYKGVLGDAINLMLAAAAYNFKRAMRVLWLLLKKISETLVIRNVSLKYIF